ncbi:MAG: hypothetical protein JSR82_01385 [Verrucomicrobia bacterium]|nr:hypothetical protein [Verrucomicrobiota bacterium]
MLATAQVWAEDEESFDALPEERVGELQPKEMREAISQVASYTPPTPATGGAPVPLDHPSARSLRYGSRQADLRAAVEGQDAAAVEKAFERMVAAAGDSEPGPRAERRKARVLELAKQEKWQKAQALVSRIIRDRRRHYQARQGEDQTTFVMLGAWLRFAQLGGTARCAGPADAGGAILNPILTAKVTDRVGQLPAAVRAVPVAQRALDAFGKISPLATQKVAKAAGCQVKDLAGQALAGL